MDWFCGILATSGSPFLPPNGHQQPSPSHFGANHNNRRRGVKEKDDDDEDDGDDDDDQLLLHLEEGEAEEEADEDWHSRRKRWCRRRERLAAQQENAAAANLGGIIRIAAFLICSLLLVMLFLLIKDSQLSFPFLDWTILDHTYGKVPPAGGPLRWFEVEKICDKQQKCTSVADVLNLDRDSATRVIFFGNFSALPGVDFESEVSLTRPTNASIWDSDTRLWPIDHGRLLSEYIAAMAILPLVLGSFNDQNGRERQQVLAIGLGGGTLDMFWHSRFPWVNITVYELEPAVVELAGRWFGAVNDDTRRTIQGDGLHAIERAVRAGARFNTILVDACDQGQQMPCPARQFLASDALNNIRLALAPMGVFVLNVLPLREEEASVRRVQQQLGAVFPTCVRTRMARQMNNIFACLPYALDRPEETMGIWNGKMVEQMAKLGLRELLASAKITLEVPLSGGVP